VYGSAGREMLQQHLARLIEQEQIDVTIVNAENTTNGRGLNTKHYRMLSQLPIDMMTMGNHTFGQAEIFDYLPMAQNIIRPLNGHPNWPGTGYQIIEKKGRRIAIVNLLGSVAITSAENPFIAFDRLYDEIKTKSDLIVVDFHAEATSEKIAFGYYVAERSVMCVGTHTHVQTADERILHNQCGYITDVGMTGPLDGVIGVERDIVIQRFLKDYPGRFMMAKGAKQLNAVVVEIAERENKAIDIRRLHVVEA